VPELTLTAWLLVTIGAVGVGFCKTAIGGVGSICVALFAMAMPGEAKASTGVLLVLLLVGDLVAITVYRRDVAWRSLGRLVVPMVVGVLIGVLFMQHISDQALRITIAVILLSMVALHVSKELWTRRQAQVTAAAGGGGAPSGTAVAGAPEAANEGAEAATKAGRLVLNLGYGSLAGFATMVANAGGAPMNLYLLSAKFSMLRFLGTGAWFFFFVNVFKLPFSISLGLITAGSLKLCALLVPLVLLGAWAGRVLIKRLNQELFNNLVIIFTAIPAAFLLVQAL
jgi:uncharacterized membrane protein YfcA